MFYYNMIDEPITELGLPPQGRPTLISIRIYNKWSIYVKNNF